MAFRKKLSNLSSSLKSDDSEINRKDDLMQKDSRYLQKTGRGWQKEVGG